MRIVELDLRQHNGIMVDDQLFVLLETPAGTRLLTNDRCPHRGGPIRLGKWDHGSKRRVCPWHQNGVHSDRLAQQSLPFLIAGSSAYAVVAQPVNRIAQTKVPILNAAGCKHMRAQSVGA